MVRVLAVADSDSYLKWTAATCAAMPKEWRVERVVIRTPITPSEAQITAAAGGGVPVLSLPQLVWRLSRDPPDVLLLGCTGPVVEAVLVVPQLRSGRRRPVLVTGLPGISVPASSRAVEFRAACDLFVVHSRRERSDFASLGRELAPGLVFALARLPFLSERHHVVGAQADRPDVVFAAQAKVPALREQRRALLLALAGTRGGTAVVKLRAAEGEEQTHREVWSYPRLWLELVAEGSADEDAVRFTAGAMAGALERAAALVTVSSTAALEAMASGVPVLVLSDFGVSAEMINLVFNGSGCLGTLDDLRAGRFFTPGEQWLGDNYFQPEQDADWLERLQDLLRSRSAVGLPARPFKPVGSLVAVTRRQLRLLLPAPAWVAVSAARRRTRRLTRGLQRRGRTARAQLRGHLPWSAAAEPPPTPQGAHLGPPLASPPRPSPRDR